jgi:urocanate hydratase
VPDESSEFQSALYLSYDALHAASSAFLSRTKITPQTDGVAATHEAAKGALAGEFIVADGLRGAAARLPLASLLAGACFLGVDADPEAAKELLRRGQCDFVVNQLDEALRILKNELRQKAAVAVCLTGDVAVVLAEMVERGVAPDLLLQTPPADASAASNDLQGSAEKLAATGTVLHPIPQEIDGAEPGLTEWLLPHGNAAMLARVDAVALSLLPSADRKRRRWLEASRYIPRQIPPARVCQLNPEELERFVDAVAGRIMSGEIAGPVIVTTAGRSITVGETRG